MGPGDARQRLRAWVVGQFGHPRGAMGQVAGWVMAHRPSNRQRNVWTVDLLELRPGERVLEIGFGPGLSLAHIVSCVGRTGFVAGIDRSEAMLTQARYRNRAAVAAGLMDLRLAPVTELPDFGVPFDAVVAVNTVGFWPDPATRFREIRERLGPGGRFAVTVQPRSPRATGATTERLGQGIEAGLVAAGFASVVAHTLDLDPPAVCVIGAKSPLGSLP